MGFATHCEAGIGLRVFILGKPAFLENCHGKIHRVNCGIRLGRVPTINITISFGLAYRLRLSSRGQMPCVKRNSLPSPSVHILLKISQNQLYDLRFVLLAALHVEACRTSDSQDIRFNRLFKRNICGGTKWLGIRVRYARVSHRRIQ